MGDANRRGRSRPHDEDEFPRRLRDWLETNEGLLQGLVRLQELAQSERAVAAVLAVPELKRARLSWQLWEALVAGNGDDPERLLLGTVPIALLELARHALLSNGIRSSGRHLCVVEAE